MKRCYILVLFCSLAFTMQAQTFDNGKIYLKIMQRDSKFGLVDRQGKIVLPIIYSTFERFYNGFAIVGKDGLLGMIDTFGHVAIQVKYADLYNFRGGLARFKDVSGKWGFINIKGEEVIKAEYDKLDEFSDPISGKERDFARCTKGGKFGLINKSGKVLVEPSCDEIGEFKDGAAKAVKDGKIGFIGMDGQWLVEPKFSKVNNFEKGRAAYSENGKWGFINKKGEIILEAKYEQLNDISEGLAAYKEGEKWGFVDTTGKVIIKPQYASVTVFHEGLCAVKFNEKQYKGKVELADPIYRGFPKELLAKAGWGFIDHAGEVVLPPYYDSVTDFSNGKSTVALKNGKKGSIDRKGKYYK